MPQVELVNFNNPQEINSYFDKMSNGLKGVQKIPGVNLPDFVSSLRGFTLDVQQLGVEGFALVLASQRGYPPVMRIEVMAPLFYKDEQTGKIIQGVALSRGPISDVTHPTFATLHSFINTRSLSIEEVLRTSRLRWKRERVTPIGIFRFETASE